MSSNRKAPVPTLGELRPVITAIAALADAFPALPGPVEIGRVVTRHTVALGISVDLHTTFADFEAWRTALGVDIAGVEHMPLATVQTLKAYGTFNGVPVVVTAYGPVYALAQAA
ncbi:hypothetical protein QF037_003272 [Streptomyces canus]|uniref:hypothetical protein n=1 Tax=Streptomyces canus TaxID=58343 RepID=UPI002780D8A3|nr:hypothetical protein [Streptomyces canus]MDQ0598927.1 hypothetical protein [Streptomyces canus]